jgi:hypothetical protein
MPHLKLINTDHLLVDPDIQIAHTLSGKQMGYLRNNWSEDYLQPLVVIPNEDETFNIIDGRHRFLVGVERGIKSWRCDVHDEVTTLQEKAALKLACDRHRRKVGPLEHFEERLMMNEEQAVQIAEIVFGAGWDIGKLKGGEPYKCIEAIVSLEIIATKIGLEGLERTMKLATTWMNQPKANSALFFRAIGILVRDGYDENLTPEQYQKLKDVIPAEVIAVAKGLTVGSYQGGSGNWGALSYAIATQLKKKAGLRKGKGMPKLPGASRRGEV